MKNTAIFTKLCTVLFIVLSNMVHSLSYFFARWQTLESSCILTISFNFSFLFSILQVKATASNYPRPAVLPTYVDNCPIQGIVYIYLLCYMGCFGT